MSNGSYFLLKIRLISVVFGLGWEILGNSLKIPFILLCDCAIAVTKNYNLSIVIYILEI
ncbi:MAG: hypothetical protein HC903_24675 [Methylacidiphilales bacterium]|nr:hypothetical protein [Candidatus Methylacidiphilales bacterium]NJR14607.1 hypothetical protein [Calothrix sp. CSU_2_0]